MTSRELAAYAILVLMVVVFLISWRIVARRRRSDRRDANARIDLMGRAEDRHRKRRD